MAINGRINVDVLFHDTDGTTSLKVVSLEDATEYTTGKVAIVAGTCGTTAVAFSTLISDSRDAAGTLHSFSTVTRVALKATAGTARYLLSTSPQTIGLASAGNAAIGDIPSAFVSPTGHAMAAISGTAAYTLVIYGT